MVVLLVRPLLVILPVKCLTEFVFAFEVAFDEDSVVKMMFESLVSRPDDLVGTADELVGTGPATCRMNSSLYFSS